MGKNRKRRRDQMTILLRGAIVAGEEVFSLTGVMLHDGLMTFRGERSGPAPAVTSTEMRLHGDDGIVVVHWNVEWEGIDAVGPGGMQEIFFDLCAWRADTSTSEPLGGGRVIT